MGWCATHHYLLTQQLLPSTHQDLWLAKGCLAIRHFLVRIRPNLFGRRSRNFSWLAQSRNSYGGRQYSYRCRVCSYRRGCNQLLLDLILRCLGSLRTTGRRFGHLPDDALVHWRVHFDLVVVNRSKLQEGMSNQLCCTRSDIAAIFILGTKTKYDKVSSMPTFQPLQTIRWISTNHLLVNLSWVVALSIRNFLGENLKQTHAKGVNIHLFVISCFFVHVWSHKFRSTKDTQRLAILVHSTEPKVSYSKITTRTIDKYIFAFEIPMYHWRILRM